jgi:hypothetical protein
VASLRGWLAQRLKAGAAKDAALELVSVAETSVRHVAQTVRPELEKAAADGQLSPEDLAELKRTAVESTRDQLSKQASALIASNSDRLEDVIGRAVEAAVNKTNTEKKAATQPAVTITGGT